MPCHPDDVIDQIYNVIVLWRNMHSSLIYRFWKHKRRQNNRYHQLKKWHQIQSMWMELKVRYRFDSLLPLFWSDMTRSFLMKSCAKAAPIPRLCKISARSTDIPQSLRKSAKPMPKMNSGSSKTPIYQNKNCCKMMQNVARCCKPL